MIYKFSVLIFVFFLSSCNVFNIDKINQPKFKKWKKVSIFRNFVSPWNEKPFGETTFQYQNDPTWFYFLFKVVDNDIQLCDTSLNNAQNVLRSDRVELFFAKDSIMQPYYTFEMDAANRLFDARCNILPKTKTQYSKHPKQINANWHISEKDLQFKAIQIKKGYQVEGKIAMSFLQKEQLIANNKLWCGIQRADFSATNSTQWICAKDPKTSYPEFHYWGVFIPLLIK